MGKRSKIQDSISNVFPFKARVLTYEQHLKSQPKPVQKKIYEAPLVPIEQYSQDIFLEMIDIRNPLKNRLFEQ